MSVVPNHLVIAPLLVPLLAGIFMLLLRGSATPLRRNLSMFGIQALFAVSLSLFLTLLDGQILVYRVGNWPAPFGIVLVADRLSAMMVLLTSVLAAFVMLHAIHGSDRKGRQFHALFQFQLFGLNGAFLTGDLFNLFVFFEVLLIASYGLLLHGGGAARSRAGLHYVVINLIGSTLFLFAAGTLYGVLGTLNMADLSGQIAALPDADRQLAQIGGVLLLLVFALKAALAPLHLWLPGAYAYAGPAAAALFAIMTKVGAYAIVRFYTLVLVPGTQRLAELVPDLLLVLGLITMVLGSIGVLASRGLALLVAYMVLVSSGTLLSAFGIGGVAAMTAGLYYLIHSTLIAAALFLLTDNLAESRRSYRDRLRPGPMLPAANLLGGLFLMLAVAAVGLPPLSGFIGKLLILQAGLASQWMPLLFAVVLLTSLLNLTAVVRAGSVLFFNTEPNAMAAKVPAAAFLVPVMAFVVLILALVVYAGPIYEFVRATAEQLAEPALYIDAVLGDTQQGPGP
jgi:multicomponent K+:H+ antiporter subunit D